MPTKPKQAAHTPGPWTVVDDDETQVLIGVPDYSGDPRKAPDAGKVVLTDLDPGDARLIAAAPDLLDALRDVAFEFHQKAHDTGPYDDCVSPVCESNRAAVAKATGEGR